MSTIEAHTKTKRAPERSRRVPELRFPEFGGEWKKEKLGEHTESISSGKSNSKDDGKYPVYGSTGIIASTDNYTHEGENILVARVGANAGLINKVDGKYGVTDNTLVVILDDSIDVKFCESFLIKFNLNRLIFGSGQPLITVGLLKGIKIGFPSLPEQQKIAAFLGAVDARIQQLQRKKELLEQYKKGVMQQLFNSPLERGERGVSLRFKRPDGTHYPDWEEKRLGDVIKIGSGKDYKGLGVGEIPVFGTGGYMLSVNESLMDCETVFIGRKGTIDKPFYFKGKFWTVDTLFFTYGFKNILPLFVYSVFEKINWYRYNEASGVPSLSKSTITSIKLRVPCVEEQSDIVNFAEGLRSKLNSLDESIRKTQTFKKGLLQQMFV